MVASARFEAGRVVYNARHVDLPLVRDERAAGRLMGRRPFTNRPGGMLANLGRVQLRTGAAHEVDVWGGSVVASDIDGHYLLDPVTLDTAGRRRSTRSAAGSPSCARCRASIRTAATSWPT